jgi:DNA-binding CsgD family transcriptional regulator
MPKWDFASIERAFVEAAIDPSRWNEAMETVARVIGARGAALFPLTGSLPLMPHSDSMAEGFEVYVRDGWVHRDVRYRAVPAAMRKGVATEFDFTTVDEIRRSPYYQEFLAPIGFRWFAALPIGTAENMWSLSSQRTIAEGPFQQDQLDALTSVRPRLCAAAALASAFGFAATSAAMEAFAFSRTPVVQLDSAGSVVALNPSAEALVGNGIRIVERRIVAQQRDATAALDRALHNLLWRTDDRAMTPPVPLPRRGRKPLLAYPLGLKSVADNPFARCRALVVLIDPESRRKPAEAVLRSALDLTAAEARLAARLGCGEALDRAADKLGIAKTTARNELRAIFTKTGVHRQAELVALLANLFGPV